MTLTISVVIPARNEAQLLPATLGALARQTRAPDEVIVVDNGSSDRTGDIARQWGATVIVEERHGVALARQSGLLAARGDWVATTDADSLPAPHWLAALEAQMPRRVALYGPLRFAGVSPVASAFSEHGYRLVQIACAACGRPNLAGANMAFDRVAALAVGGYPAVLAREDVLLGWKLRERGAVRYVRRALVLTSARRLEQGWPRFLAQQIRNMTGDSAGYFPS